MQLFSSSLCRGTSLCFSSSFVYFFFFLPTLFVFIYFSFFPSFPFLFLSCPSILKTIPPLFFFCKPPLFFFFCFFFFRSFQTPFLFFCSLFPCIYRQIHGERGLLPLPSHGGGVGWSGRPLCSRPRTAQGARPLCFTAPW